MAAETLTATKGKLSAPQPGTGPAGNLKVQYETYSIAANVEAGDVFAMVWVPACTVLDGRIVADQLDTHNTPTLDMNVGWAANGVDAADPDGFGNFGVWDDAAVTGYKPEVGHRLPFGGTLLANGPKTFTVPTQILVTDVAAAATFAAGQMTLIVEYVVND